MNALIRKAQAWDILMLIDLSHRTINASYRAFLGEMAVDAFLGSGAADRYVEENLDRCLVSLEDETIVGYAVFRDNLIDLMMIDHTRHRQGLGTHLLRYLETLLFERHDDLRLESFVANQPANAFYRRNGWLEVSSCFDNASGTNKVIFQKWRPEGESTSLGVDFGR